MMLIAESKNAARISAVILALLGCADMCVASPNKSFYFVKNEKAIGAIVISQYANTPVRKAAKQLQQNIKQSSGASLPIITPEQMASSKRPQRAAYFLVGPSSITRQLGINGNDLPTEAFRIKTMGQYLILIGHDYPHVGAKRAADATAPSTMWAINWYLDHQLGVLWLWPGELGTYIPSHNTIEMPSLDVTHRPQLIKRRLRFHMHPASQPGMLTPDQYKKLAIQMRRWATRHELGSRGHLKYGHAFTDWWKKYHKEHPNYFAQPPSGEAYQNLYEQKGFNPSRIKLRVGNPAVVNQIVANWRVAGAPDNWDVCPNDGAGFDTSDVSRAMDVPANQNPVFIWKGKANLTARYVKFWNHILTKMRAINPNVTLSSYAYSAYRNPPPEGVKLHQGMVIGIVDGYNARAKTHWQGWHNAGAKLFLRPNWFHMGGVAPVIPLHAEGDFFVFARHHGMIAFDFDSIMGNWSTQGSLYYLIARLSQRPDLSVDKVIQEYCSAFKQAAPVIKDYLNYWQNFTKRAAYTIPAGGGIIQNPDGLYQIAVHKYNLYPSPGISNWEVIPYLYTDQVIDGGMKILNKATKILPSNEHTVKARVQFLKDGLKHLRLTRDVLRLGYNFSRPKDTTEADFVRLAKQLQDMRKKLSPQHVIWGTELYERIEPHYRVPTVLGRTSWGGWDGAR